MLFSRQGLPRAIPIELETRFVAACTAIVVLLLAGNGCGAADRPNFSGSWELDVAQSSFGPMPGPSQSTQIIEHNEPVLRLRADSGGFMGENHVEFEFVTDGSEKIQTVEGKPRKTRTYWEEAVLVTEWEIENPLPPRFEIVERRSLSVDGQTMTVERQVRSNWAEWEQKAVFARRPSEQDVPTATGQSSSVGPRIRYNQTVLPDEVFARRKATMILFLEKGAVAQLVEQRPFKSLLFSYAFHDFTEISRTSTNLGDRLSLK